MGRSMLVLLWFVGYGLLCNATLHGGGGWCGGVIEYDTGASVVEGKLNVHLVPHSHDDVGWLKTVDQYYIGSNNSIQVAAVQYILDSVVAALLEDSNRKFIYVEQRPHGWDRKLGKSQSPENLQTKRAFFQRWWREQTTAKQELVKQLVQAGQLEFINGGWCMHDEATTHYIDMIDQTTLGHRYIKQQFGKVPRVGWQIDPFGHSSIQAYLLGAELGFDAVFFARADYQDVIKRRKDRTMEVVWRASKSLGASAQIFAGVMAHHYDPPDEFRYDISSTGYPIQDDPLLYDFNVQEQVDLFVKLAQEQSQQFRTNHIMWAMGDDFAYENANTWFKQMDKLIHYVNQDGRVNALYSTPSIYLDSKHAANERWPLKTDDYFPYADCPHCYWTGYYSSRSALKGYVRKLSGFLQAARQLEFLVGRQQEGPNTDSLEEALAILQHHDGVSGTEKQHVANDYASRLAAGAAEAAMVMNAALASLISAKTMSLSHMDEKEEESSTALHHLLLQQEHKATSTRSGTAGIQFEQCLLLNVSYCPPSEGELSVGKSLVVVVYNPLGWFRKEFIRIPVSSSALEVSDAEGNAVPSQLVPLPKSVRRVRNLYMKVHAGAPSGKDPLYSLVFSASIPPLGYGTFIIRQPSTSSPYAARVSSVDKKMRNRVLRLNSNQLQLSFSSSTGQLMQMMNLKTQAVTPIQQSYCWYNGSDANTFEDPNQASGAYVFRPNTSTCFPINTTNPSVSLAVIRGPLVEEVHQTFSPWLSQVIRVYKDAEHAEVEFTVGPIPIEDSLGKEVVTKLTTELSSNGEFYTDSNGRDFLKRVRDHRPDWELNVTEPIAGNYYPLNLGMYLRDSRTEFSVLVDRALGGSSIVDGQLELMLHRRLLYDDGKGVSEALNETVCDRNRCEGLTVQGLFFINVNPSEKAAEWRRFHGQQVLMPLQLAFSVIGEDNESVIKSPRFSAMESGYKLPPNVAVVTLQELEDGKVLLRLAHIYEVNESDELSKMATVDLRGLFVTQEIKEIVEVSLSANQKKSDMKKLQWKVEGEPDSSNETLRGRPVSDKELLVELAPMEIRTFCSRSLNC